MWRRPDGAATRDTRNPYLRYNGIGVTVQAGEIEARWERGQRLGLRCATLYDAFHIRKHRMDVDFKWHAWVDKSIIKHTVLLRTDCPELENLIWCRCIRHQQHERRGFKVISFMSFSRLVDMNRNFSKSGREESSTLRKGERREASFGECNDVSSERMFMS